MISLNCLDMVIMMEIGANGKSERECVLFMNHIIDANLRVILLL